TGKQGFPEWQSDREAPFAPLKTMRTKQHIFKTTGLTYLTLLLALIGLNACRPDSKQKQLRVRLTWLHQAQFAGIYLAEDQGFYKNAGLNVTINAGGIEYSSVKMVTAGTDDLGLTSADQILLARAKGVPLIALAAL